MCFSLVSFERFVGICLVRVLLFKIIFFKYFRLVIFFGKGFEKLLKYICKLVKLVNFLIFEGIMLENVLFVK